MILKYNKIKRYTNEDLLSFFNRINFLALENKSITDMNF